MYIIGKWKDYYDGVAGSLGIDKTIVFERDIIEIEETHKFPEPFKNEKKFNLKKKNPFHEIAYFHLNKNNGKYEGGGMFIIGFCGKLYLGWKFVYPEKNYPYTKHIDIIYGVENVIDFIEQRVWRGNFSDYTRDILNYDPIEIFREYKTPYFVYDLNLDPINNLNKNRYHQKPYFIINPVLKDYEFYKVFDPFTAFQEIQMFLSGVLGTNERDIVEVEDKYKIAQHGFDKWSFRKEPNNK